MQSLKKLFSYLLVFSIVFSSCIFFDIGFGKSEAAVTVDSDSIGTDAVTYTLLVPETIYLTPGTNAFQYFCNNTVGGNAKSTVSSTGTFIFNCIKATSVTVSAVAGVIGTENTNIMVAATKSNGTSLLTTTSSSINTSISSGFLGEFVAGERYTITWTVTFIVGGTTYTAKAYTVVYSPNLSSAGQAYRQRFDGSFAMPEAQETWFITGAHSYSGGNATSMRTDNVSSSMLSSPLISISQYQYPGGNNSGLYLPGTYYSGMAGGYYLWNENNQHDTVRPISSADTNYYFDGGDSAGMGCAVPAAHLTVDISRFTNFNQIPNLKVCFAQNYHHCNGLGNEICWIRSGTPADSDGEDVIDGAFTADTNQVYADVSGFDLGEDGDNTKFWSGALNGVASSSTHCVYLASQNGYSSGIVSEGRYTVTGVNLVTTAVNKANLRANVVKATTLGFTVDDVGETNYNSLHSALKTAAEQLGDPTCSSFDGNAKLNAAILTCQTYVEESNSGTAVGLSYFYVPETIYLNPLNGTGFQYYVDCNEQGVLTRSANDASGDIYFRCPGATSVKITCLGNVSACIGGNSFNWLMGVSATGETLSGTVTSGALSVAAGENQGVPLTWVAEYTLGGCNYSAYAYTCAYRPLSGAGGTVSAGVLAKYETSGLSGRHGVSINVSSWATGIHAMSTSGYGGADKISGMDSPPLIDSTVRSMDSNVSDNFTVDDMVWNDEYMPGWSGCFTNDCTDFAGNEVFHFGYFMGIVSVDSSRYNNLNQVPNLKVGMDVHQAYTRDNSPITVSCGVYSEGSPENRTNLLPEMQIGDINNSLENGGMRYSFSLNLNGIPTSGRLIIAAYGYGNDGRYCRGRVGAILNVTSVNKSMLRDIARKCTNKAYQVDMFNYYTWRSYSAALTNAYLYLGDPKASQTEIDNAYNSLVVAMNELTRIDNIAYEYHYSNLKACLGTEYATDMMLNSSTAAYRFGDNVTAYSEQLWGYSYLDSFTRSSNLFNFNKFIGDGSGISTGTNCVGYINPVDEMLTLNSTADDAFTNTFDPYVNITNANRYIKVEPGATYRFSMNVDNPTVMLSNFVFFHSTNSIAEGRSGLDYKNETKAAPSGVYSFDFTTPADCHYILLRFGITTGGEIVTCSEIRIEKTPTPTVGTSVTDAVEMIAYNGVEWNMYYAPDSTSVVYNPNGGTFNGTTSDTTDIGAIYNTRYIRIYSGGNNVNTMGHLCEIEVMDANGVNHATDATITCGTNAGQVTTILNDGNYVCNSYISCNGTSEYVLIDLGEVVAVRNVNVWMYYLGGRYYFDKLIALSEDDVFDGNDKVLVNSTGNAITGQGNSGKNTNPIYGRGYDEIEAETNQGRVYTVGPYCNQKYNIGMSKALPERAGYTFLGWGETQESGKVDYAHGDLVTVNWSTQKTLYAKWSANDYYITYDMNYGYTGQNVLLSPKGQDGWEYDSESETYTFVCGALSVVYDMADDTFTFNTSQAITAANSEAFINGRLFSLPISPVVIAQIRAAAGGYLSLSATTVSGSCLHTAAIGVFEAHGSVGTGLNPRVSMDLINNTPGETIINSTANSLTSTTANEVTDIGIWLFVDTSNENASLSFDNYKLKLKAEYDTESPSSNVNYSPTGALIAGGQPYGQLPVPQRIGYTFWGWFSDAGCSQPNQICDETGYSDNPFELAGDTTFYAQWLINEIPLVIKPNGGTWYLGTTAAGTADIAVKQNYATTYTLPTATETGSGVYTLKRAGYTFRMWSKTTSGNGNLSGNVYTFGSNSSMTDIVVAQWIPIDYTITYVMDGGVTLSQGATHYNMTSGSINLSVVRKTGYTLSGFKIMPTRNENEQWPDNYGGWSNDQTLTAAQAQTYDVGTTHWGNITATAQWTVNSTTLTLNPNGGAWYSSSTEVSATPVYSGNLTKAGIEYNTAKTIPSEISVGDFSEYIRRVGYTFAGWTLSSSGNGSVSSNETEWIYTAGAVASGTDTVTANWTAKTYTVVYRQSSASETTVSDEDVAYGSSYSLITMPEKFARNGYSFSGWMSEKTVTLASSGNTLDWSAEISDFTELSEINYNAVWTLIDYTVTYDPNGGEVTPTIQNYNTESPAITIPTPTRQGYVFNKWSVTTGQGNWSAGEYSDGEYTVAGKYGSPTLVAQWTEYVPDPDAPQFVVSNSTGKAGRRVSVTVSVKNNPGLVAAYLNLSYDSTKLSLIKVTDGELLGSETFVKGNDLTAVPYTVFWEDALATEDYTQDGELVTYTFDIFNDAELGETPITLSYTQGSTFNSNIEPVEFECVNGSVEITELTPGDASGDKEIDLRDVVLIRRWLAGGWNVTVDEANGDVNDDGITNLKDVVLIRRYLAGGWGVVLL